MQRLHTNVFKAICAVLLFFSFGKTHAQPCTAPGYCPTLTILPDTFYACKNSRPQIPTATINGIQTGTRVLDTFWSPATNLTRPDSIVTQAYVGNAGQMYTLTLTSIRPTISLDSDFDGNGYGSIWNTDYFPKVGTLPIQPQFFMVTTNPSNANPNFASFADHTGNAGNMMVVNGAIAAGKVVYSQTIPVIPCQTYELLAWAAPATPLFNATLAWRVNGVLVTGSSLSPTQLTPITGQWQPVQANYYNASATSMTIEIVDFETYGDGPPPGNDFALDDITVKPLCIQKDSVYVAAINLRPLIDFTVSPGCKADTAFFNADTTGTGGLTIPAATIPSRYLWKFGDGQSDTIKSPTHLYTTAQDTFFIKLYVYKDVMQSDGTTLTCVDSTNNIYTGRNRPFKAAFTKDKDTICRGDIITFTDSSKPINRLVVQYFFDYYNVGIPNPNDSSRLKSPTHTYDTGGIFTVLQVVTDQYNCKDTARDTVVSIQPANVSFSISDTGICQGQTVRLVALVDSSYENYLWLLGDGSIVQDSTTITHTYLNPATYLINFSATNQYCPSVDTTRELVVLATPRVNLGGDTTICPTGQPIVMQNLASNTAPIKYMWNTGDETPQILVRNSGVFFLQVTNTEGCVGADTMVVLQNCFLDIPNIFTPNGDGESDYFLPRQMLSKGLRTFKMKIYNRWGQQVFETQQVEGRGWDGKLSGVEQPVGVYLYFIEATLQNGATEKYDGNLTLLR